MDVVMVFVGSIITPKTGPFVNVNIFGINIYMFSVLNILNSHHSVTLKQTKKYSIYPVNLYFELFMLQ